MNFEELHTTTEPLLIGNVWDVTSATLCESAGYKAIGTSSAAIASILGYQDNGTISFQELLMIVKRIKIATALPLSVDIENGYASSSAELIDNIQKLIDVGVSGINIEDSIVTEKRELIDVEQFARKLHTISNYLSKTDQQLFINARTDTFLLGIKNALDKTKARISRYDMQGANGIFIPGIVAEKDIRSIVDHTVLPINVMCMPDLASFDVLKKSGVKRISMGNFLHQHIYANLEQKLKMILTEASFKPIFDYASR